MGGLCEVGFLKHELKMAKMGRGVDCLNFQLLYNIVTTEEKCLLREKVGGDPPAQCYVSEMTLKDK